MISFSCACIRVIVRSRGRQCQQFKNVPVSTKGKGENYATAAGIVLLAKDPSVVFPQCRILADAYRSTEPDGDPRDHEDIRAPPLAIDRAIAFIDAIPATRCAS